MSPLPVLILYGEWCGLFSLGLPCFLSSLLGLIGLLGMISYQTGPLGFHSFLSFFLGVLWPICFYLALYLLLCLWACLLPFPALMAHFALFLSFFLLRAFMAHLFLFCFAFISYCACGPAYCHFLPCWLTGLYLFLSSLGFYGQFISICFSILLFFIFCLLLGLSAIGPFLTKIGINTHLPHFSRNSYN